MRLGIPNAGSGVQALVRELRSHHILCGAAAEERGLPSWAVFLCGTEPGMFLEPHPNPVTQNGAGSSFSVTWREESGAQQDEDSGLYRCVVSSNSKTEYTHAQLCLTLFRALDCSPPGSSVHGTAQARIPEWAAISSSRLSSPPRSRTHVSYVSCIGRQVLYH